MEKPESRELVRIDGKTAEEEDMKDVQTNERVTWSSQRDFIMAAIGCAVGTGNVWRFPYLCYKNGGGAFFIPYLTSFFLIAAPVYIMEASIGQYTSSGVLHAWDIVPAFRGIGYAAQFIFCYSNVYYIVVIAWAVYYLYASLQSELPWASCGNAWNTDRCYTSGMDLNRTWCNSTSDKCSYSDVSTVKVKDAVEEYWEQGVLHVSSGIDQPGQLVPGLTISLIVAWLLVFVCICKGVRWTGKIVYVTVTVPYILLTVLLIRGLTLEGAVNGIIYYLKPNVSRLWDARVWIDGATQVLYSVGIAQGYVVNLGSYNKFHSRIVRNSFVILIANSLTSVYGGLAVFSVLGFMAHESGASIDSVVAGGPGLVFQTYPKAATQMPLSPLWSALFFLTIIFVGLDSQFVSVESFVTTIADSFPVTFYKSRNRIILTAVYCLICLVLGLTLVTQGGVYLFRLIDYYAVSGVTLLFMCFSEVMAIGWIFGADRFHDVLEMMTGRRFSRIPWLRICWKFIAPLIVMAIFWFEVVTYKPLAFSQYYEYPTWATGLGVMFTVSSVLWIPGVFLAYFATTPGSIIQRWRKLTTPILKPHQVHPMWKEEGYKWFKKGNK